MIVGTEQLGSLAGTVSMVDGGFDPLHDGHVAHFREAARLGLPVLCNVSSDDWVARKHAPILTQEQRVAVIEAIRWIDYVHAASTPTVEVLRDLRPRYYVKGADWRDRLPDEEVRVCDEHDVEVVFLDTVSNSSTAILKAYEQRRAGRG
jgi:cytidyltransferase-like protein